MHKHSMPYQILCNGTWQKSQEARSGLSLVSYHCTSLHNIRHGIQIFPLYCYSKDTQASLFDLDNPTRASSSRQANLASAFLSELTLKLNLKPMPDGKGNLQETIGPEDVLDYMYAVFYSQTYRFPYT